MTRSNRIRTALVALAISATALTGVATAAGGAETKVTIKEQSGDFSGKVKSSKLGKCADGRKIWLYKQNGSEQDPKNDEKYASDTASVNGGNDYAEWNTGNTGAMNGKFYARAAKINGCKADTSKTVKV